MKKSNHYSSFMTGILIGLLILFISHVTHNFILTSKINHLQKQIKSIEYNNPGSTKLNLLNSDINSDNISVVIDKLRSDKSISSIDLSENNIGDQGAIILADELTNNISLQEVTLWTNEIGDEGAVALAKAIQANRTLKILDLTNNKIGFKGAEALEEAKREGLEIYY